jgi:acyl-CoA hydrolase
MPVSIVPSHGGQVPIRPMSVVDMVWPDQSNHHGTLFGGAGLSILDRQAFIMGSKVLRGTVVTAAVSRLDFTAPAPAGHLIECQSKVVRLGRRSVTIDTRLIAEDLISGERTDCLSGEFVMVRRNSDDQSLTEASSQNSIPAPEVSNHDQLSNEAPSIVMVAEIVFPGHANHRKILHGGPAMAWIAKAGFVAATRKTRRSIVMAASERLDFKAPAYVGDVVEVIASVISVGRRSVHVQADMWAESPETGERRHCTSGKLVYVAIES